MATNEGYLLIDNRDAPGSPGVPAGAVFESATITCLHCNGVVVLNPNRKRPRGYCAKCGGYVCDTPACGLECRPFQKLIDQLRGS